MIKSILGSLALLWALIATAIPMILANYNPLLGIAIAYLPIVVLCGVKLFRDKLFLSALALTILSYMISYDGKIGTIIPLILMPSVFIFYTNNSNGFKWNYRLLAYLVFLVNCGIVIYEYSYQINLLSFDLSGESRFRATGLWMHPLMNAILHTACVFFILASNINKYIKIATVLIGIYVIFMFDARVATVTLFIGISYIAYLFGFFSAKRILYLAVVFIAASYFVDYLETSDLGGKLFDSNKNTLTDSSTVARFKAFQIFGDADLHTLLFGADKFKILFKYGCVEIENAVFEFIFLSGSIIVIPYLYLYIKGIFRMMKNIDSIFKILILGTFLFMCMFCSSFSKSFMWLAFIFFYKGFGPYEQIPNKASKTLIPKCFS